MGNGAELMRNRNSEKWSSNHGKWPETIGNRPKMIENSKKQARNDGKWSGTGKDGLEIMGNREEMFLKHDR